MAHLPPPTLYPSWRRLRRTAFLSLALLFAVAGPLSLVSCGGDASEEDGEQTVKKSSSKKSSSNKKKSSRRTKKKRTSSTSDSSSSPPSHRRSGGDSDAQLAVDKLLRQAKSSGANKFFSSAYNSARSALKQGRDAAANGEDSTAERLFARAKQGAEELLKEHATFQKDLKAAQQLFAKLEEDRKKAKEDGVAELAGVDFEDAEDEIDRVKTMIADADPDTIGSVKDAVGSATEFLADAVDIAQRNKVVQKRAVREKEAMVSYKERAKTSGADSKALSDWLQAEQAERNADGLVEEGNFQEAVNAYQLAAQTYIRALQSTVSAEEMKLLMAKAEKDQKDREARNLDQRDKDRKSREAIEREKSDRLEKMRRDRARAAGGTYVPGGTGGTGGDAGAAATFRKQQAMAKLQMLAADFGASIYRQDLDPEDEEFLREHYSKLSDALSYDPDTGVAFIDYINGSVMRKDILAHYPRTRSLRKKRYLSFTNPMMQGAAEEAQSFLANTKGRFFIPVPFRYRVKITWDMAIQTMDGNGSFNCVVMYDPKKRSSYRTEWIHWKFSSRGGPPQVVKMFPEKKFRQSANYWFDKTRDVPMIVEFKMPGEALTSEDPTPEDIGATALLSCSYDANGPDEKTNRYLTKNPLQGGGWVGFQWSRAKFTVKKLQIEGILHKQLAVAQLRKMTGIKKKTKTETKARSRTKPEETEGDDAKPEKKRITDPKDGFDF